MFLFFHKQRFYKKQFRVLSGCSYCRGAVMASSEGITLQGGEKVVKCFHCGRMFRSVNGELKLWPYREYPHLDGRKKRIP